MGSSPIISVIMNCYNGARFLHEAIESVIAQTYHNWEIIFWDNQSTDDSAVIVKSYMDPRIKYYYAPTHTVLYEARNYAIEQANGEFIAFLDIDDWWLSEKLERQIMLFEDPEVGIACTNYWIDNERNGGRWLAVKKQMPTGRVLDGLLFNYSVGLLTLMVRRSALPPNISPFDSRYHIIGDFDFVIRVASIWKLARVQIPLANYRIHGGNESIKHRELHIAELECWQEEQAKYAIIKNSPSFRWILVRITYGKGMNALLSGNRGDAFFCFRSLPWCVWKARLFAGLLMPTFIVKKLKI